MVDSLCRTSYYWVLKGQRNNTTDKGVGKERDSEKALLKFWEREKGSAETAELALASRALYSLFSNHNE